MPKFLQLPLSGLYLHCSRDDTTSAADRHERCIADVGQWMSANRLKLNTDYGQDRVAMGRNEAVCLNMALFLCCNLVLT